jgi:predicted nucleic acid-binding protein
VLDPSALVVLASGDPRGPKAQTALGRWIETGETRHAPALLPYEVAGGLTRLVAAGAFPRERLKDAWETVFELPIEYHPLERAGEQVVGIALQLGRQSAHDAAHLALAQELRAQPWTFGGPLARNAASAGFPVDLIA